MDNSKPLNQCVCHYTYMSYAYLSLNSWFSSYSPDNAHTMAKILTSYYINIIHAGFVDIVVNRDISQRVHCLTSAPQIQQCIFATRS